MDQIIKRAISIQINEVKIEGDLSIPFNAKGIILFAHGSGSSRFSSRNRFVAHELNEAKFATLLFDLLTKEEEQIDQLTGHLRFDIEFLAKRLLIATKWVKNEPKINHLPIGYFGASTGGAAALTAAGNSIDQIFSVVSRGGRPDLVKPEILNKVKSPTLLIVGSEDREVIELNEFAFHQLQCDKKLEIIPGASHLFEEPGKLELVAKAASTWFLDHI